MVANAAGNYIDNAIAAIDAFLDRSPQAPLLRQVRRELIQMKASDDYMPGYGRFLIEAEPDDEQLWGQLIQAQDARRRSLARRA